MHHELDWEYPGDEWLRGQIAAGADLEARYGPFNETPLLVATRRRRLEAVEILLEAGADAEARNHGDKTAWQHAVRRGFTETAAALMVHGVSTALTPADRLAVACSMRDLQAARDVLAEHPGAARTGNPEEDRLLADMAGRDAAAFVTLLIDAGADVAAPGLDGGTPLHQACWFGQPEMARILVAAGAPLDVFDPVHEASPIGWVTHGSRYSGGADERQEAYVQLAEIVTGAGCSFRYPGDDTDAYLQRLLRDATPPVARVIRAAADKA
ncbi:MAG: ankyrin repeat domain-containing protein [Rhodothermales bacterium]|nr:ankyrin repeat domain-containing protein [Rhodothermales bacterium]MBO6780628.1 ankyrin repeat domain-containing protein [Rhodothermales bacterium]